VEGPVTHGQRHGEITGALPYVTVSVEPRIAPESCSYAQAVT